jgi:hypothetical protein
LDYNSRRVILLGQTSRQSSTKLRVLAVKHKHVLGVVITTLYSGAILFMNWLHGYKRPK